jgi:gliding motility-associated-like protein
VSNFVSATGCDSLVTENLIVLPVYNIIKNISACENSIVTYPDGSIEMIIANTSQISTLASLMGCDSIIVTNVTMNSAFNTVENITVCEGETVMYPDGSTEIIIGNTSQTSTLTSVTGCDSIIVTNVIMNSTPVAAFTSSPEITDVAHTEVEFTNNSIDADYYEWNFGDGSTLSNQVNPLHYYPDLAGQYYITLLATNNNGLCRDSVDAYITINDELIYYVPNAFTPDGDAFNNTFTPVFTSGFDAYDYHLTVFNRWGEIIFESYNAAIGWDGTYPNGGELCQDGVYVWRIEFGETKSDKRIVEQGHVTLLK